MNRSVSYEWTLRAAKNLPGFVSYNGSLTPKDGKTKEEIEEALDCFKNSFGFGSPYGAIREKKDDTGALSYEISCDDHGINYYKYKIDEVCKVLVEVFDGKIDLIGADDSRWQISLDEYGDVTIKKDVSEKDMPVKEYIQNFSLTTRPEKELSPTKEILIDKGTAWTARNLNDSYSRELDTLQKELANALTQEQANRIFELKEKANKLDVRGWSCESENIRTGYAPDPANTSKFIPCNIFRNDAFGVYILADYNGDILLQNANNLITRELRDFMKIEGEMKKVMDDPEYGKDKELLSDKESSNENPDRDKIFSFQGEEISDEDPQQDTEHDGSDDFGLSG